MNYIYIWILFFIVTNCSRNASFDESSSSSIKTVDVDHIEEQVVEDGDDLASVDDILSMDMPEEGSSPPILITGSALSSCSFMTNKIAVCTFKDEKIPTDFTMNLVKITDEDGNPIPSSDFIYSISYENEEPELIITYEPREGLESGGLVQENHTPVLIEGPNFAVSENTDFAISYDTFHTNTLGSDFDGDEIWYEVVGLTSGFLTNGNKGVKLGDRLGPGDTWVWLPSKDSLGDGIHGFSVRAFDGELYSKNSGAVTFDISAVKISMSGEKDILDFDFLALENSDLSSDIIGVVKTSSITAVAPYGTDIRYLRPQITIDGATVFPANGVPIDFSGGPVKYTVTASDSTTKEYLVSVTAEPPPTYNVYYFANGGTGFLPSDTNDYLAGTLVTTLKHGTLSHGNLVFIGWNTQADGYGTDIAEDAILYIGSENVALYAKWGSLSGELGILDVSGLNPSTGLPWQAGDKYRLAFITSTTTDAVSDNIGDYNNFVQAAANSAGLGAARWYVIASTATSAARDNTLTGPTHFDSPIFRIDGALAAIDNADLWDGGNLVAINVTENGAPASCGDTWTGTTTSGIAGRPLGSSDSVGVGRCFSANHSYWINVWHNPPSHQRPVYALSEVLTVKLDPDAFQVEVTITDTYDTVDVIQSSGTDLYIDWGDGSGWQHTTDALTSHTYTYDNVYPDNNVRTLSIRGDATLLKLESTNNKRVLTKILSKLKGLPHITDLSRLFYNNNLVLNGRIPHGFLDFVPKLTNTDVMFANTTLSGPIPIGLFDNSPLISTFLGTFSYGQFTLVPDGLFANKPLVTTFRSVLSGNQFTTIPDDIFDNVEDEETSLVTSLAFALAGTKISSVHPDLFKKHENVTSMEGLFQSTQNLLTVPEDLFRYNTEVSSFRSLFRVAKIQTVPEGLFNYNNSVTGFRAVFEGCPITSNVPRLWETHPSAYPLNAFTGTTTAANYCDIPQSWGGPDPATCP